MSTSKESLYFDLSAEAWCSAMRENYGKLIKVETYRYNHEQRPFNMQYVQLSTAEGYSNDEG